MSVTQLNRELREARRLNESMYVPTYVPLTAPKPAHDGNDHNFDPYLLGNESLRNFLHSQGAPTVALQDPSTQPRCLQGFLGLYLMFSRAMGC